MNIVDPILFQCRRQPPAAAICVPGPGIGLISYRRLEQFIHNVSRRLHALGLPERSIVAISIGDVIFHSAVLLASMRLGMIAVSLREGEISLPFKIDALIADGKRSFANMGRVMLADLSWTEGDGRPLEPHLLPQTHEDDLCRLILTSGTSSTPKAVAFSHKRIATSMARLSTFGNRIANCSRIYCDVPISSSLGFRFLIYALSRGGMAFFPGENFSSTLRVIEDYKVQCLVGSPSGFENLLRWFDTVPSYQSNVEVIYCGGDVLSRSLSDRLRSRICSHLICVYSSTEAGVAAVAHAHEIAEVPRAVGFVPPGVTVQIVDASGTLLPPGQEGQVRLRSEYAVGGYFGNPEESEKVFRDGWFYPGDLGTLSDADLLVITGRAHAILNLGGNKISPEPIELVLAQFPGVVEAAAVAVANAYGNNEICAVVVSREKLDEAALRTHCDARIPRPFAPVKYIFVDSLPHNEMGKLDRGPLQETIQRLAAPARDEQPAT
jgi:acyl-CoA synthetase (AMP-forming)/AMP-acid ligase II